MTGPASNTGQRVDRWLWFARIFKSRSLATKAVEDGAVRITRAGQTIRTDKPSYALKPGDVVTLKMRGHVRVLEVKAPGARRGPAAEAQMLYRDLTTPSPAAAGEAMPPAAAPSPGTRPNKQDRRAIERFTSRGALGEE